MCVKLRVLPTVRALKTHRSGISLQESNPQALWKHELDFSGYAGSPLPSLDAPSSPYPTSLARRSRCDWNTEPHSEEKVKGRRGADSRRVFIFTVCGDLQPHCSASNVTVTCLQSSLAFLEGTWESSLKLTAIGDGESNSEGFYFIFPVKSKWQVWNLPCGYKTRATLLKKTHK